MTPRLFWPLAAVLIVSSGALAFYSAQGETQTWDEGIHIAAGYSYLTRGDYRVNQEHPPLAKLLAAVPLRFLGAELPVDKAGWQKLDSVQLGIDFLYGNRIHADTILAAARAPLIALNLAFIAALGWWTRRRFGSAAALLAIALCAFDPNLIAHSRYVTTDAPVTGFFFMTCALWIDYLERARLRDLAWASLAFALAMTAKFSAVLLIPILAALYAIRWAQKPGEFPLRRAALALGVPAAALFVAVNALYWPETMRCLRGGVERLSAVADHGSFTGLWLYRAGKWFHLPAHAYLAGLNKVATHNVSGHINYLLGQVDDQGWWYYFPVVFAVKSTLAALAACLLLCAAGVRNALRHSWQPVKAAFRSIPIVWIGLLFPPLFYFAFSMNSGINLGMRHLLPIYPFFYVAAAGSLSMLRNRRVAFGLMAGLGAVQAVEAARIAPDYLAYFNALSGGPGNGPRYLVDSNIDWGQDLKKLRRWLDDHGAKSAYICYFGNAQMGYYGIDGLSLPGAQDRKGWDALDGYVVANVTPLNGAYVPLADLAPLRLRQPVAKVGWSMYVYDFRKHLKPGL